MNRLSFAALLSLVAAAACTPGSTPTPTPGNFTVLVTATHATVQPSGAVSVKSGATQAFTVTADSGFTLSQTVTGTCAAGSWAGAVYTTGAITKDCAILFTATANAVTHTVTVSGDSHVTFAPTEPQTVADGATQAFTITPVEGWIPNEVVSGTCPAGSWAENVYTTGAVHSDCTVIFSATQLVLHTVTASGDGQETITPSEPQQVADGLPAVFHVVANEGYTLSQTVGGTCPAGTWNGADYATAAISGDCTVTFSATQNTVTHNVSASGDGHETIAPSAAQTVEDGATQAFTVTADGGFTLSQTVGGTCPAGSWSSNVYTTGAITADCTVTFSATANGTTYTVTSSGDGHVTISPSGAQTVADGATQAFTVTADGGFLLSQIVGGTCPAGSWSSNVYTTGAITADCTVTFSAAPNATTYTVTASGDGHETISPTGGQIVTSGATQAFTVTPDGDFLLQETVGGTCPTGSWSGTVYTTGAIVADCTVSFSATATVVTHLVTATGTGHETFDPAVPTHVNDGETFSITVGADEGYVLLSEVGGTCAAGSWDGYVYTTGAVTADCTVEFKSVEAVALFSRPEFLTTSDLFGQATGGTAFGPDACPAGSALVGFIGSADANIDQITPVCGSFWAALFDEGPGILYGGPFTLGTHGTGDSTSFQLLCPAGQMVTGVAGSYDAAANGTNPAGVHQLSIYCSQLGVNQTDPGPFATEPTLAASTESTSDLNLATPFEFFCPTPGAIASLSGRADTTNYALQFGCELPWTVHVSATGDEFLTLTPETSSAAPGDLVSIDVEPAPGHLILASVTGTCPAGDWYGYTYILPADSRDCTVEFSSVPGGYASATGDGHLTISPSYDQPVALYNTVSFTVTPDQGYALSAVVGGTCPSGTWEGNVYTIGAFLSDCTVEFSSVSLAPHLAFVQQPGDLNDMQCQTVKVAVVDTLGNVVTSDQSTRILIRVDGFSYDVTDLTPVVDGVATLEPICVGNVGTRRLVAVADGFESVYSDTFEVTVGPPANVQLLQSPPQDTVAGQVLPAVLAGIHDANGYFLPTASGNVTIGILDKPANVHITGTLTKATVNGAATFDDLVIDTPGTYRFSLSADINDDTRIASGTEQFTVGAPAGPASVSVVDLPAETLLGQNMARFEVHLLDGTGALMTSATNNVTLGLLQEPGGDAAISGTLTKAAVNGVAVFDDVYVDTNGTFQLSITVTAGSVTVGTFSTGDFDIILPPTHLVSVSGDGYEAISPSITRAVFEGFGAYFTVEPTSDFAVNEAVGGTCPAGAWSGTTYHTGPITADCSVSFSARSTLSLTFDTQPSDAFSGDCQTVVVSLRRTNGEVIQSSAIPVALTAHGPAQFGDAGLDLGTLSFAFGAASFDVCVPYAYQGYTLVAKADAWNASFTATSDPFDILADVPARVGFVMLPVDGLVGQTLSTVKVEVQDVNGNRVPGTSGNITIRLSSPPPGVHLTGTLTRSVVDGVAIFDDLVIDTDGIYRFAAASDLYTDSNGYQSDEFSIDP